MKNSFVTKSIFAALMAMSLGLTACNKKDNGSAVKVAGRGGQVTTSSTCSSGQSAEGRIYDPTNSGAFEQAVKVFVSATIPSSSFGTISGSGSGTNGVFLTTALKFDSSGQVIKSGSSILIKIVDSLVGTQPSGVDHVIQPYEVQFTNAYSGSIDKTARTFNVTFQDQYGYIQLSGSYDNSYASGRVTFQNYSSVDGSSLQPYSMGTFYVPTCGLLK